MIPKYLFLDDEEGSVTDALLDGFDDTKLLSVDSVKIEKNESFESVCGKLKVGLSSGECDGVLIDLCLDGTGANSLAFKAQPFAQQIRTWASESKIPHIPVVLCSTIEKKISYSKDSASHDLFDYYFNKTEINFNEEALKMNSLAEGYQLLNKEGITAEEYLNRADLDTIGDRTIDYLIGGNLSPFDISHRIIKDVFCYSGLMIDSFVLAARFGVDIKESGESWLNLLGAVSDKAGYTGVFSQGWSLFWTDRVNGFYMDVSGGTPYQLMNASERVEVLVGAGFEGLVPAKPIPLNNSSYFNTVCESCLRPLDSMEGIPIEDTMSLKPWQQNHFVSFYAVARGDFEETRICKEGIKKKQELKARIEDEQTKREGE